MGKYIAKQKLSKSCLLCKKTFQTARVKQSVCSRECRTIYNNQRAVDLVNETRETFKCRICGRDFVQIGSHVVQKHGYKTAREYREEFGYLLKKAIVPESFRKMKREQALENGTSLINHPEYGIKTRFVKGDSRAKEIIARTRERYGIKRLQDLVAGRDYEIE